jgi:hypothetical protein
MTKGSCVRFRVLALGLTAGLALALPPSLSGQGKPFVRVTEEQGRAAMDAALAAGKDNELSVRNTFQKEIRKIWSDYDNKSVPVYERAELNVAVLGPAQMMVATVVDKIIMSQPIGKLGWNPGVSVSINPRNENSPDVVKVVVTRAGADVAPISTNLVMRNFKPVQGFAGGRTTSVHEGSVIFPSSAFETGALVKVEAVLEGGRSLSRTLSDSDLKKIQ